MVYINIPQKPGVKRKDGWIAHTLNPKETGIEVSTGAQIILFIKGQPLPLTERRYQIRIPSETPGDLCSQLQARWKQYGLTKHLPCVDEGEVVIGDADGVTQEEIVRYLVVGLGWRLVPT